jgi:hypothetical protein
MFEHPAFPLRTDVHQHLWPEALVAALTWRREPPFIRRSAGDWLLRLRDEPDHRFDPADHDPVARAQQLAVDGVQRALVAMSSPLGIESLPRDEAEPLLEAHNAGLLALGEPDPPFLYISTGSHTKFVAVDREGRIDWSLTTLSGELLLALQRETILAELIDLEAPPTDLAALEEGARFVERAGLSRALFGARLLNRMRGVSVSFCSDFLHGAVAGADLLSLRRAAESRGGLPDRVAIGGQGTLGDAYRHLLQAQWGVAELRRFDVPLGALGAWNLFTTEREAAHAGAPEGRS